MAEIPQTQPAPRVPRSDLRRHLADAVVPNAAFLLGNAIFGVTGGVIAAVAAGLALVIVRLMNHHKPTIVFAGFAVVLLHAGTVVAGGEGRDYFLPWLVLNIALTLVFAISLVVNRPITLRLKRYAGVTSDRKKHRRVTALWAGLCLLHLLVALPLYSADMVVALGVAKFVLGPPAFLFLGALSWRMLTHAPSGDEEAA